MNRKWLALLLVLPFLLAISPSQAAAQTPPGCSEVLCDTCGFAQEATATPAQPDLALGAPAPRQVSACSDICVADFKICRDSCTSLACYFACRDAYDECIAGC